jgi:uncharacterized membrane protein YhaH (DUF805 family)
MGPITAIATCVWKYFDFGSRAARAEYWWFALLYVLVVEVGVDIYDWTPALIVGVALFIPLWAVGARRLHDINRSGWWQLVGFVPVIGWLILLYWMVKRGDDGRNDYGLSPH